LIPRVERLEKFAAAVTRVSDRAAGAVWALRMMWFAIGGAVLTGAGWLARKLRLI
jgi:hypothetical protein